MDYIIGIDFDNTLISYDDVMHRMTIRQGLILPNERKSKKGIRDHIRRIPNGEIEWQRLQTIVYGAKMDEARLMDGVQAFFELCQKHKARVYIVSHKTEYANLDETEINLRTAAMTWMGRNGFFEADGLGLSPKDVYFESTRRAKIERIRQLQCTHFIDDLEETFLEDSFPVNVEKILYAPYMQCPSIRGVSVVTNWKEVSRYFFGPRG